jgi:ureidoacrylate peracid hydrolase
LPSRQADPAFLQEASVDNVEKFFGWVSNTAAFCGTISQAPPGA